MPVRGEMFDTICGRMDLAAKDVAARLSAATPARPLPGRCPVDPGSRSRREPGSGANPGKRRIFPKE